MVQSRVGLKKARLSQTSSSVADDRRPDDRRDASGDWNGSFKVMLSTGPSVLNAGSDGGGDNTAASVLPTVDVACSATHLSMALTKSRPAVAMEARETTMAWRGMCRVGCIRVGRRAKCKASNLFLSGLFSSDFEEMWINFAESRKSKNEKIRRSKYQAEQDVLEGYMLHVQGKLN